MWWEVAGRPMLHDVVPQMVEQLVDFLAPLDFRVAEQVIEVPKIVCPPCAARTVLRAPQTAEQLVEVPTVAGGFMSDLLLTSAALGINTKMRWHAAAASAAAPSDRYVHDSLFVNAGVLVSVLLMTPAAAFVGISANMPPHAVAAPGDLHVSEFLSAIVGLYHVLVLCWNILDWPSRALGALVFWNCDIGAALA